MMPLNAAERKKAFLNFVLFFAVTTAFVVIAVYFGMQVPFRQNQRLKQQVAGYEQEKMFMESFSLKMDEVEHQLDSINRAGVQADLVEGKIVENLKKMNAMIDADSFATKKLYQNVVQNYADLKDAKKLLRDASGKDQNLSQYMQQIESLKGDLARKEATILQMQMMSMQARGGQAN